MVALGTQLFQSQTAFLAQREDGVFAEFCKALKCPVQNTGAFLQQLVDEARVLLLRITDDHVERDKAEPVPDAV